MERFVTRHFASLFDSRYAPQGLALYESLLKHSSEDFQLYVLPMDQDCYNVIDEIDPAKVFLLDPGVFENDMGLKEIKESRTHQEWCWSAASNLMAYIMEWFGVKELTYVDSDMFFFSDPKVIFDRIGDRSIGITPHYFPDKYKYLERNGKYCVSIAHFKGNEVGRKCLSRWAEQCREWCKYENAGPGKFADQGYLDEFVPLYGDEVSEIGYAAALAPWNLGQYALIKDDDGIPLVGYAEHGSQWEEVVAYHFHEFLERSDGTFRLTNYPLRPEDIDFFYTPYIEAVKAAKERIEAVHLQSR